MLSLYKQEGKSRTDISKWKEAQSAYVQQQQLDLEVRKQQLDVLKEQLQHFKKERAAMGIEDPLEQTRDSAGSPSETLPGSLEVTHAGDAAAGLTGGSKRQRRRMSFDDQAQEMVKTLVRAELDRVNEATRTAIEDTARRALHDRGAPPLAGKSGAASPLAQVVPVEAPAEAAAPARQKPAVPPLVLPGDEHAAPAAAAAGAAGAAAQGAADASEAQHRDQGGVERVGPLVGDHVGLQRSAGGEGGGEGRGGETEWAHRRGAERGGPEARAEAPPRAAVDSGWAQPEGDGASKDGDDKTPRDAPAGVCPSAPRASGPSEQACTATQSGLRAVLRRVQCGLCQGSGESPASRAVEGGAEPTPLYLQTLADQVSLPRGSRAPRRAAPSAGGRARGDATRVGAGQVPRSCTLFCGGFSHRSLVRRVCWYIHKSPGWSLLFLLVAISNSIYIGVAPSNFGQIPGETYAFDVSSTAGRTLFITFVFDLACMAVLLLECVVAAVALGCFRARSSWLRRSWYSGLDLFIVLVAAAEYLTAALGHRIFSLRAFRLLRVLKITSGIRSFRGVHHVLETLAHGAWQLLSVLVVLVFFVLSFAIGGISMFSNSFSRSCVLLDRPVPSCSSDFTTGWRPRCSLLAQNTTETEPGGALARTGGFRWDAACTFLRNSTAGEFDGRYALAPGGQYHSCQLGVLHTLGPAAVTARCAVAENPQYGLSHFDDAGGALLTVLQSAIMPDGFYNVVHRARESEPDSEAFVWAFFVALTALTTLVSVGIFIAVVSGTWEQVNPPPPPPSRLVHPSVLTGHVRSTSACCRLLRRSTSHRLTRTATRARRRTRAPCG